MKVAIITEGFNGTGYGHLTRCLSIYQAFEEKGIIPTYIANCDETGKKFINDVNLLQFDWVIRENELKAELKDFDVAIIDSYLAPIEIYQKISDIVNKIVYIDDFIRLKYPPGIIVNGTVGAENLPYPKDDSHKYLLGIDYVPLRKAFWDISIPETKGKKLKNVLITFGAQDVRNLTNRVLSFLINEFPNLYFNVVVSEKFEDKLISENIKYYHSLRAVEILDLMLKSDLAITAAGQTTYELARIGLPTIAIGVAKNQKYNLKGWLAAGFIKEEIWFDDTNLMQRIKHNIIEFDNLNHKLLVDGQGARRISEIT